MHIDVKQYLIWSLKEECLIQIEHDLGDEKNADLLTKNLPGSTFEKHVQMYCGIDKYIKQGNVWKVMWDLPNL